MNSMGFSTPLFLFLFLPVFMALFHLAGKRLKLIIGIVGSIIFYAQANLIYVPLMLALILLNYFLGKRLGALAPGNPQRRWLWAGIIVDIGLLAFFKAGNSLIPPLGLSYVSFQLVSYLVDVTKKTLSAETDFLKFAFYVLLFPKIMVGPITRYGPLQDQIGRFDITPEQVAQGIRRFVIGLAKKILIADVIGKIVAPVFSMPKPLIQPWLAWLVIVGYGLQLYFDFSGYTDMAIGLGKMMGLQFVENFNLPYISRSISEFWRRWHISLCLWFRDYVFFPLERHRLRWIGQPINILIVFALTGLWHRISLNYLVWGLIHGAAIVFENSPLGRRIRSMWAPLQHVYALAVILVGWVFFRSPDLRFAARFLLRLAGDARGVSPLVFQAMSPLPIIDPSVWLAVALGVLFSLPVGTWVSRWMKRLMEGRLLLPILGRIAADIVVLLLFVLAVAALASSAFAPGIYDKF